MVTPVLTDAHTHRTPDPSDRALRVYSLSSPSSAPPDPAPFSYSAGVHPLHFASESFAVCEPLFARSGCAALGECGLDRRAELPLTDQLALFRLHAEAAERVAKPLIVHCVRAYDELLRFRKNFSPGVPWIVHGCRGNERKIMALLEAGFLLSFGEGLLRDEGNLAPFFDRIPIDRILLETDESTIQLEAIYACAASLLHQNAAVFAQTVERTFRKVFSL